MKVTKNDIMESYMAYDSGDFKANKLMKASLAYRIYKNMTKIKVFYQELANQLDHLQDKYGWKPNEMNGGLTSENAEKYNQEYRAILDEEVDVDIELIPISEIANDLTIEEAKSLYIMISDE